MVVVGVQDGLRWHLVVSWQGLRIAQILAYNRKEALYDVLETTGRTEIDQMLTRCTRNIREVIKVRTCASSLIWPIERQQLICQTLGT